MKKVVGGLAVSLVLLVGATACGGGDDAESGTSPTTAAAGAPSTTAAAGGSSAGSGSFSADEFCDTIDELLAATKSGDDASKEVARKKAMELYPKAAESMRNDPTSADKIVACIAKAGDLDNY